MPRTRSGISAAPKGSRNHPRGLPSVSRYRNVFCLSSLHDKQMGKTIEAPPLTPFLPFSLKSYDVERKREIKSGGVSFSLTIVMFFYYYKKRAEALSYLSSIPSTFPTSLSLFPPLSSFFLLSSSSSHFQTDTISCIVLQHHPPSRSCPRSSCRFDLKQDDSSHDPRSDARIFLTCLLPQSLSLSLSEFSFVICCVISHFDAFPTHCWNEKVVSFQLICIALMKNEFNRLISIDPIGCSVLQKDEISSTSSSTVTGFLFCTGN